MIRLPPSRIELSSRDLEEANERLQLRRPVHRVPRSALREAYRIEQSRTHARGAAGTSGLPSLGRLSTDPGLFQDTMRGSLGFEGTIAGPTDDRHGFNPTFSHFQAVRSAMQTADTLGSAQSEDGNETWDQLGHEESDELSHEESRDNEFYEDEGKGTFTILADEEDEDRHPLCSSSPFVEHPSSSLNDNDLVGQVQEPCQGPLLDRSVAAPGISPDQEFHDIERRFAERLNLDGTITDVQAQADSGALSFDAEIRPSPPARVNAPSPGQQWLRMQEGYPEHRRSRLPPSRLSISQAALPSSPDRGILVPETHTAEGMEPSQLLAPAPRSVRDYPHTIAMQSFAESDGPSADPYNWTQGIQGPLGGVGHTEMATPSLQLPSHSLATSAGLYYSAQDAGTASPMHFSANSQSNSTTAVEIQAWDQSSNPPEHTQDPAFNRSRYSQYRVRSPLAHSPPPSPRAGINLLLEASRYVRSPSTTAPRIGQRAMMHVYNDQLPGAMQPQTPSNQRIQPFNPTYTAPTGIGRLFRLPRSRRQGRSGSVGRGEIDGEQENVSTWVEAERWERRIRASLERRRRRWRSSGAGSQSDRMDGLEQTPEREVQGV